MEAYRQAIDPHRRLMLGVVLGLIALVTGLAAAGNWQTWLLFVNRMQFGHKDPQFHLDISFFVFDYPFLRMALSFLFAAVLLVAARCRRRARAVRRAAAATARAAAIQGAKAQLFVLAGIFVALKATAYWVDRYGINFSQRGVVQTGASYTDVHAVLPAKTVLAVIAVICAVLFLAGAARRSSLLPAIGFGLLVLSAVLIGGVYPFIIQQFVVGPNQQAKERPYIEREIGSTRTAYGVTRGAGDPLSRGVGRARGGAGQGGRRGTGLQAAGPGRLLRRLPAAAAGEGLLPVRRRAVAMDRYRWPARSGRTRWWASGTWPGRRPARSTGSTRT